MSDSGASVWTNDEIDEGLRWALAELSIVFPRREQDDLTLAADGRFVDVSSLTGCLGVYEVWYPWDSSDPEYPPERPAFEHWVNESKLYLKTGDEPQSGDKLRVFWFKALAVEDLDSATASTYPTELESLLVEMAAAQACAVRSAATPGTVNVSGYTPVHWRDEAERRFGVVQAALDRARRQAELYDAGPVGME